MSTVPPLQTAHEWPTMILGLVDHKQCPSDSARMNERMATQQQDKVPARDPELTSARQADNIGQGSEDEEVGPAIEKETAKENAEDEGVELSDTNNDEPLYSIFSDGEKRVILIMISFIGLISAISASIYLPALNTLAKDLHVSTSLINLTITTYMIMQGIAPSILGSLSDVYGRRPAYTICFVLYIAANIGLALQSSYPALAILRCLQSAGSSATIALGSAVVADVSTRAERGKWIAWAMIGTILGPTLGPVIGGLFTHFLGWRAIFWFLTIFSSVMATLMILLLPETCRRVVGNGSVPPPRWNTPLLPWIGREKTKDKKVPTIQSPGSARHIRPLASLRILFDKECGCMLLFGSLQFAGYFLVLSTLAEELNSKYSYNPLQAGLCFIPLGVGSVASRYTATVLVDWNYRRVARHAGIPVLRNRQEKNLDDFPIEKARLQIGIPMTYSAAIFVIIYGWVMNFQTSVAGPLVSLFLLGVTATGTFTMLGTLIVDINLERPATAVAAVNLARCLTGAAFTAFALPLIHAVGIGWTGTIVGLLWILASPLLWLVMWKGPIWRRDKRLREQIEPREKS